MGPTDELERRFRDEMAVLLRERIGVGSIAAGCVYPFFILEDYRLAPDQWEQMATLRLVSSILCMLLFAVNKTVAGEKHPYALAVCGMLALGLLKTLINPPEVQGIGALYFGGHALLLVGALSLLPLSFGRAFALGGVVLLSFLVPTALLAHPIDPTAFGVQNSLMLTMVALLSLGCHLNYGMRFREFELRSRLYAVRQRATDYG